MTYNLLDNSSYIFELNPNRALLINVPANKDEFSKFDYETFCGVQRNLQEVDTQVFLELLNQNTILALDVREALELPDMSEIQHRSLPLSKLLSGNFENIEEDHIVCVCNSGIRSMKAAGILKKRWPTKKIESLKGGLEAFHNLIQTR